jgi:1,4-dihydroxy-2-naphthoyl-CoA hydrolase
LASMGAALWFGDRGNVVGVNNNTDFYRAVSEGLLTSTAKPLHQGRSQQVWLVETEDEAGRVVARGQVRLQNLATP